jgi:hypothetical protein
MNFDQRLDAIEHVSRAGALMSVAEMCHWFWLFSHECSSGIRELGEQGGYEYPNSKPLFSSNIMPDDWVWFDENRERYLEAAQFLERTRKR